MGFNVVIEIVTKDGVDSLGVLAPVALFFKEEKVVFEAGVQGRSTFRENTNVEAFAHKMGVVIDVNVGRFLFRFKSVEVDAFSVILTDIVAYDHIVGEALHDAAEPIIVMAVVVLDEGIDAVVISIKAASVYTSLSYIAVGFVVLNFDPVRVETEDAVSGTIATTTGQGVEFIDGIFAYAGNDVVAPGILHVVSSYINPRPKVLRDKPVPAKGYTSAGRVVANTYAPNLNDPVVSDAKIVK